MPYLLASQHQLVHASCLITCMWFNWEQYRSIIKIVNNTYHSTEVFDAFKYINMTHFLCLFIELSFRVIEYRESLNKTRFSFSYLTKILQLIKMVSYFLVIQYVQFVVINFYMQNQGQPVAHEDKNIVWLLYEIVLFYANIFSQMLFIFISRVYSFMTLKEKFITNFSKKMRYRVDFLDFVKDDIHWFTILASQSLLCQFAFHKRQNINESTNVHISWWLT